MASEHQPQNQSRGSLLSLLALFCMAAVISGLIVVNYFSQHSLQEASSRQLQQNLADRGRSISYFLSERENDLRSLANAAAVVGYFTNKSLGMTMAYGLRASLNNINRLFEARGLNSRLETVPIYSRLSLLDENGSELARWPEDAESCTLKQLPDEHTGNGRTVLITSQEYGLISFTMPVHQQEHVQGYLCGQIRIETLVNYLLHDIPGTLVIFDQTASRYQSPRDNTLPLESLHQLVKSNRSPFAASKITAAASQNANSTKPPGTVYAATVPGYNFTLAVIEDSITNRQRHNQLVFMASLIVLSIGAFGMAALIFRAGARQMVLETSLVESTKREKAITEKKEELELVLEAARLGTWSWNIATNQVEFNERYWAMLGYTREEMPEQHESWRRLLHPEDAAYVIPVMESHLAGVTPFMSSEYRMRHKAGHWVWIHDTGKILKRDADGRPLRAFGIHLDITERKDAIRMLAKAKDESDAIICNFLDTLIVVNTFLTVIRVNQATCNLLGYREDELVGQPVSTLFHDTESHVQRAFSFYSQPASPDQDSNELRNIELCYRHKNGSRLPMSFNISLLKDDYGTITGVVAGAKDISGLRLAFDTIARQKEYIETIFDIIPQGLLALSPDQTVVKSNRAFRQILADWPERLGLSQDGCSSQLIQTILDEQEKSDRFIIQLKGNNQTASFQCSSNFLAVLEGVASVVVIKDITAELHAEEFRKLLATVIEQTGDSVFITGTDEIIRYANPAAVRSSGYGLEELVGSPQPILTSDLMLPEVLEGLRRQLASGQEWHGHFRSRRKDGSIVEEDATISPVRNEEGIITHFVNVKRDVTETMMLQQQLVQAQKLEAIGQLAAGIAHEINTPMQYVQNNVSFIEQAFGDIQGLLDEIGHTGREQLTESLLRILDTMDFEFLLQEIPESIKETHDGINRVVKIVSAMKEFSHPGSADKAAADLNRNLESTILVCRNEWKYVAELETDFDPDLPLVPCYSDKLNQACLNLIINAAHAIADKAAKTSSGGLGHIGVSTRRDGGWVEIRISDTGNGIPPAIQDRIFEPFFTTKEVGKGTGQGLTIAHDAVVKKHGGTISFITQPGEGTTFILRLPMITTASETQDEQENNPLC